MQGDPIDPVTFKRAAKELFERLAAHEGIDLIEFYRAEDDAALPEVRAERRQTDERLGELRAEAEFRLQALMIVEDVRCWTTRNGDWKRVTQEDLKAWLMSAADERPVFYLDRHELAYLRPDRYTVDKRPGQCSSELANSRQGKRGRPPKSGTYAASDAPLLDAMRTLLENGEARSVSHASNMVAHRAEGGGSEDSKATRLRKAYVRRWGTGE